MLHPIIIILCCIFIPPLGVYLKTESCDIKIVIACVLWWFMWLPGVIYALLVYNGNC
eukprot:NODE_3079_length_415_cov_189.382514_g2460_i0.p2 GENE.NODE_3079_length_415_cov_189.382514_g2460_i0~~NODE_3079_length_415_cov_189.382514_g2460_i0.p2  ORF type:complete len:57 (-),score=12.47 NODE_3079_length_415_cov_189.382514_g2460_i0:176-346(-)